MESRDIVVIGGSTGSTDVLKALLADLPEDLPASVFVVTHVPAHSSRILAQVLNSHTRLTVSYAEPGAPIERGRVYLASPDRHLLLTERSVAFGAGPRENMVRPSIDPLFRSAALAYGPRVIGVVLTGMLSDGAAGLAAIKAQGGVAVVQDPETAAAPEMPQAALRATEVDRVASPSELASVIAALAGTPAPPRQGPPPPDLRLEVEIAAGERLGSDRLLEIADPIPLTCPQCDGVLSEVRGSHPLRFRCQTGHAVNADVLDAQQHEAVEEALRVALRVLEERVTLTERLAVDARGAGRPAVASLYDERNGEYRRYAKSMREGLLSMMLQQGPEPIPE